MPHTVVRRFRRCRGLLNSTLLSAAGKIELAHWNSSSFYLIKNRAILSTRTDVRKQMDTLMNIYTPRTARSLWRNPPTQRCRLIYAGNATVNETLH